jgi:hypothetical protein
MPSAIMLPICLSITIARYAGFASLSAKMSTHPPVGGIWVNPGIYENLPLDIAPEDLVQCCHTMQ